MNALCRRLMEQCSEKVYSLVLLDVDFFLRYRARFSPGECDEIWRCMRAFLLSAFGPHAVCETTGSDEMAVLLPGVPRDEAVRQADEVRTMFRRQNFLPASLSRFAPLRMSFSAGVVGCPLDDSAPERLGRLAVSALFMAKAGRRNQVYAFPAASSREPPGRRLWDERLCVNTVLGRFGCVGRTTGPTAGSDALLFEPQGLACDELGRVYVADTDNHQVLCLECGRAYPVAGSGSPGYAGDGAPALQARLNKPTAVWVRWQRLYIADTGNDAVRQVDLRTGTIAPLAGCAHAGYSGDGGPAAKARLNKPGGVVTDRFGRIYINDIANNVVRRIDPDGIIRTFAGTGKFGFSGDGGAAEKACFNEIYGIGIDWAGETLYLADYGNHRIRRIDLASGVVSTLAGCGRAEYSGDGGDARWAGLCRPVAVCGDAQGNVLIADAGNSAVRVVAPDGHIATLLGGLGPGVGRGYSPARYALANPNGLAAHRSLYLLDGANNRVCHIDRR